MTSYTDFTGFTYNGEESRNYGITRVSDGSRYTDQLLPQMKDTTVDPTGVDGQLFFSTYYKSRQINLNLAFDCVTEKQLRGLRQLFDGRQVHPLIFYERPYKVYEAKVTGNPEFKVICFDERVVASDTTYTLPANDPIVAAIPGDDGVRKKYIYSETPVRIYKGEGSVQMTAFTPFAHTPTNGKFLDGAAYTNYSNVSEWSESAGLLPTQGSFDTFASNKIPVYNPGDVPTPFKLKFTVTANGPVSIKFGREDRPDTPEYQLNLTGTAGLELLWESQTGLLYLCDENHNPTTTVKNNLIISGTSLFNIGKCTLTDASKVYRFVFTNVGAATIDYDYLYF